jgi:hypothetical protein
MWQRYAKRRPDESGAISEGTKPSRVAQCCADLRTDPHRATTTESLLEYNALAMESFVGTTGWYLLLLFLGLATGALIQWFRRDGDD